MYMKKRFEKVDDESVNPERKEMGEQFGSFSRQFQTLFFPQGALGFKVQGLANNHEAYQDMRSKFVRNAIKIRRKLESGEIATLDEAIDQTVQVYAGLFVEYQITPLFEGAISLIEGDEFVTKYQLGLKISWALQRTSEEDSQRFLDLIGGNKDDQPVAVARADLDAIQEGAEQEQTAETQRFGGFCDDFQEYFLPEGFIPPSFVFEDDSQRQEVIAHFRSGFASARAEVEAQVQSGDLTADQAIEEMVMRRFFTLLAEYKIWISIGEEPDMGVQNYLKQGRIWLFEQVRDAMLRQQGLSAEDRENTQVGKIVGDVQKHIFKNLIVD
jgi:hypothetical protein